MHPDMKKALDAIMGTGALDTGSAAHPSDRLKLLDLFIRFYRNGITVSVADWEAYLIDRGWDDWHRHEVVAMPSDVRHVAREFGH